MAHSDYPENLRTPMITPLTTPAERAERSQMLSDRQFAEHRAAIEEHEARQARKK